MCRISSVAVLNLMPWRSCRRDGSLGSTDTDLFLLSVCIQVVLSMWTSAVMLVAWYGNRHTRGLRV